MHNLRDHPPYIDERQRAESLPRKPASAWLQNVSALLASTLALIGCTSTPAIVPEQAQGKFVCDSYIIFDMCVGDIIGNGTVDMVYFSDTEEVFMYRQGMKQAVVEVMPLHRCAVPLNAGMP